MMTTICDKINTVGTILQENLNDRGVSCTFGTGTGESTVLDMVGLVNGTNFKGSSDVVLKVGANRPYLLSGESTDVIVKLENGLCEPLKNKNVVVGQSVFRDGGIISNYTNWDNVSSTMQMTRQVTYTELKRKTDASSFGYIVKELSVTDGITIEFDFKQATIPSANDQYLSFRDSQGNSRLGISRNYESLNDGEWHHYKLVVNGLTVTPTIDGVQKSNLTLSGNWSRIQLEARNNAVQHFKNFVIYENINSVTDGKGEFALYDVSVTDDTIFNATYGTETATTNVYLCQFVDYGTSTKHNDIWYLSNATLTRDDSYSTLLETTATGYAMSDQYNKIPPNSVVEFDICQTDGSLNYSPIYIRNDGGGVSLSNISYNNLGASIGDWVHIKIVFNNTDTITVYSDKLSESFTKTLSATSTNYRVMLYCSGDMTTIKFKNFAIY